MKKWLPLLIALTSIAFMLGLISHHHRHIALGQVIYVQLTPVDPRSLLQGDYMQLGYNLHLQADKSSRRYEKALAFIELNDRNVVIQTSWQKSAKSQPLWLSYNRNWQPAADSFFFAEGLGACYEQARFAKLSLYQKHAVLLDLVDENLQDLACQTADK